MNQMNPNHLIHLPMTWNLAICYISVLALISRQTLKPILLILLEDALGLQSQKEGTRSAFKQLSVCLTRAMMGYTNHFGGSSGA